MMRKGDFPLRTLAGSREKHRFRQGEDYELELGHLRTGRFYKSSRPCPRALGMESGIEDY